jgi:hypothetical protein
MDKKKHNEEPHNFVAFILFVTTKVIKNNESKTGSILSFLFATYLKIQTV